MPFINRKTNFLILLSVLLVFEMLAGGILTPQKAQAATVFCANCGTEGTQMSRWIADKFWQAKDAALSTVRNASLSTVASIQVWDKADTLLQRALKLAWNAMKKQLLDQLSSDILGWAQGENGYVYDWQGHLSQTTYDAGQQFMNEQLSQAKMCGTFDQQVRRAVSGQFGTNNNSRQTLQQELKCPTDDNSMSVFLDDFTQGGWDMWLEALEPSGNPWGSFMIAQDAKDLAELNAYSAEKAKLIANQGNQGTEQTPGIIQSYAAQRASMMDLDYLLQADNINEYLSSLVDAFINRIAENGFQKTNFDDYQPVGAPPQISAGQSTLDAAYAQSRYDHALRTADLLGLTDENLTEKLQEQSTNLSLMEQIRKVQDVIRAEENCQLATPDISQKISILDQDINAVQAKIQQTTQAEKDMQILISAMQEVIAVDKNNSASTTAAAIGKFTAIHSQVVTSLQTIFGTSEIDLARMVFDIEQYNIGLIESANAYIANRGLAGYPQANTLYWQLAQEKAALAACLIVTWPDQSPGAGP